MKYGGIRKKSIVDCFCGFLGVAVLTSIFLFASAAQGREWPLPQEGLELWLKASELDLEDGERVALWPDGSESDHRVHQTDEDRQPLFAADAIVGRPAVRFDGVNDYLKTNFNTTRTLGSLSSFSLLAVMRPSQTGENQVLFGSGDWEAVPSERWFFAFMEDKWYWGYGDEWEPHGATAEGGVFAMAGWQYDAAREKISFFLNGQEEYRQSYYGSGIMPDLNPYLGALNREGEAANFSEVEIAELAIYNRPLTAVEMLSAKKALASKYGITIPGTSQIVGTSGELENALADENIANVFLADDITADIELNRPLGIDFGQNTLYGDIVLDTDKSGVLELQGWGGGYHIAGRLMVDAPQVEVKNNVNVGKRIKAAGAKSWEEVASGNKLAWHAAESVLKIYGGVEETAFYSAAEVTGAERIEMVKIDASGVIMDRESQKMDPNSTHEPEILPDKRMQLWKKISLGKFEGGFVIPADLTGDGNVEFLLSYVQDLSAHKRLVALNLEGEVIWSYGDDSITETPGYRREPPCRPAITAYDFNDDGRTEVIVEFWNEGSPQLVMLAGATGEVIRSVPSPFDMAVRRPSGFQPSRPTPQALVAHLDGVDRPASVVLKYEASGRIPPLAVAYDYELNKRWEVAGRPGTHAGEPRGSDMGHHALVTDLTGDGREDVVLGQLAVDSDGEEIFRRDLEHHADGIDVFMLNGEKHVLLTLCINGPAYVLKADGSTVWEKTQKEVPHGQAGWVGDFLPDRTGLEAIIQVSGHFGIFHTFDAEDGQKIAEFEHHSGIRHPGGGRKYPDMPVKVRWRKSEDSLWVPVDRKLLNGRGEVVARLGEYEEDVVRDLRPASRKGQLAVQAVPVDLCGDEREELVLYQPYHGKAVYVFTQPDSDAAEKPYVPQEKSYNRPSYY